MRTGLCFVGIACMVIGCADEGYRGEVFYSVVDNGSGVELTWSSFEGADYYEIRLNGRHEADTADTSYRVITPCKTIELYAVSREGEIKIAALSFEPVKSPSVKLWTIRDPNPEHPPLVDV